MNTKKVILAFSIICGLFKHSYSQLYLDGTNGNLSVGSTTPAPWGFPNITLWANGSALFSYDNGSFTNGYSAAYIRGSQYQWSSPTLPDYTWWFNDQTGFYHPYTDILGVTIGGNEVMQFNSNQALFSNNPSSGNSAPLILTGGSSTYSSASTLDYTWWGDATTGFYHPATDIIGVSSGGTEVMQFNSGSTLFSNNPSSGNSAALILTGGSSAYSSASTPDYTWLGDAQTGFYHPAWNILGIATNGISYLTVSNGVFNFDGGYQDNSSEVNIYTTWQPGFFVDAVQDADWEQALITTVNYPHGVSYVMHYNGSDNFYVEGDGTCWSYTGLYTGSDRTLKENIKPIENALYKILHLSGVSFNYIKQPKKDSNAVIPEGSNPPQIGLIAQDVEKVVPEVVKTNDKGIKGVAYQNLVALLIEAIKEKNKNDSSVQSNQQKAIDSLRNALQILQDCCNSNSPHNGSGDGNNGNGDNGGASSSSSLGNTSTARLFQNVPNPFTQTTSIKCFIPDGVSNASILVFDMTGALKNTIPVNGRQTQYVQINGSSLSAGMYYYSLIVDGKEIDTKKMILTQ